MSGLWKSGLIELETSEGIAYVSQEQKFVEHWSTENHLGIVNKGKALQLLEKMELPVGVRASSLSGGQKQRLALAMVMAAGPGLLLLDEGFHAIDYDRRRNCFDMLKEAGVAIIFVSHDSFDLEQLAVRSLRLEAGSNGSVLSERP